MKPVMLRGESPETLLDRFGKRPGLGRAAEMLARLGIPDKKSEIYRYFDMDTLMQREWEVADVAATDDIEASASIVVTDGRITAMPEGLEMEIGCSDMADIATDHFDPLYYLGHLMSENTILLRIKKDTDLRIVHRFTTPEVLLAYRIAIYVDANVRVSLLESYEGEGAHGSLILNGYDLFAAADTRVTLIKSQTVEREEYVCVSSHRFKIDRNAEADMRSFDYGSGSGLQTIHTQLHEHSSIDLSHLLYISGAARRGTVSKTVHIGRHSQSRQEAKSILQDNARGIFDAIIKVEHSGKYTRAHQNSKAILLNKGAYMASKPQLEIYIDDLEASHGSTTGRLDERQLFYLRSRGIAHSESKKMLIQAFANEMIDTIDNTAVKEGLHADFEKAYYGRTHVECMETCHGCEEVILNSSDSGRIRNDKD